MSFLDNLADLTQDYMSEMLENTSSPIAVWNFWEFYLSLDILKTTSDAGPQGPHYRLYRWGDGPKPNLVRVVNANLPNVQIYPEYFQGILNGLTVQCSFDAVINDVEWIYAIIISGTMARIYEFRKPGCAYASGSFIGRTGTLYSYDPLELNPLDFRGFLDICGPEGQLLHDSLICMKNLKPSLA